jgi:vanillate O-demethylase monooxygenase subunit
MTIETSDSAAPLSPAYEASRRASLIAAEERAVALFDAIETAGLVAAGRSERDVERDIYDLALARFGVEKHWHKRIVRAGSNTLTLAGDNPPVRTIGADDTVYVDLGPVFEEWEADVGRTYLTGDDANKARLIADLPQVFARAQAHYRASPGITGAAFYEDVRGFAQEAGWSFGGAIAGHVVGEFPHAHLPGDKELNRIAPRNPRPMSEPDGNGQIRHWILEIHLVDPAGQFGGVEAARHGAVEVDDADHGIAVEQRHDEFRARGCVAGDVAGKIVHVLDHDRLTLRHGGPAHALADGDAHAGRLALERPEHQLAAAQAIEARPVQLRQKLEDERRRVRGVGDRVALALQQCRQLPAELAIEFRLAGIVDGMRCEHLLRPSGILALALHSQSAMEHKMTPPPEKAGPAARVDPPRGCSFDLSDWDVLSRSWYAVARSDEVADKPVKARLLDMDLVVYRTGDTIRVARDLCAHRGAALSLGWIEGDAIVCPYHGLRYDPDGRCIGIPAHPNAPISPRLRIAAFPAVERFGLIWTTLNGIDENLPAFDAWNDPDFQPILAPTIDIESSAGRQVEGFLDVAHFAWAHTGSFGDRSNPLVPSYAVERTQRGIRAEYLSTVSNYPHGMQDRAPAGFQWLRVFEVFPPFTARLIVHFPNDGRLWILNAASPVSARRTRLFCPLARNFDKEGPLEDVHRFNLQIFTEDRLIVESQRPEDLPLDTQFEAHIPADRTSIAYRKLLKEMGLGASYAS